LPATLLTAGLGIWLGEWPHLPPPGDLPASIASVTGLDPSIADGDELPATSQANEAEADAGELTRLLDSIPGAWEQAELGRVQGAAGQTTPLDQV
jgi:hypothetical protein